MPVVKPLGGRDRKETGAGMPTKLYTEFHDSSLAALGKPAALGKSVSFQAESDTSPSPAGNVGGTAPQRGSAHSERKPALSQHLDGASKGPGTPEETVFGTDGKPFPLPPN